jgi:hypothetical protein
MLAMKTGDRGRAVSRMQELLRRIESDGMTKSGLYLSSLGSLAYVYSLGGQFVEALDVSRQKFALDEVLGSQETNGAYIERLRTSQLLFVLGRIADTRAADEKFLIDFHANGEGSEDLPLYLNNFAQHALVANEFARALALIEPTVAKSEKAPVAIAEFANRLVLVDALLQDGRLADAQGELRIVEALAKEAKPGPGLRLNLARIRLGLAEGKGDSVAVRSELDSLRTALEAISDPINTDFRTRVAVVQGRLALGRGLLALGNLDAAAQLADDSLVLAKLAVLPGQTSAWVGQATLLRALVQRATAHPQQARALAREAEKELSDTLSPTHPLRLEARALALDDGQLSKTQAH